MGIINTLCQKYREMIQKGEEIDLDEMTTELADLDLKDVCSDLAEYLEKNDE